MNADNKPRCHTIDTISMQAITLAGSEDSEPLETWVGEVPQIPGFEIHEVIGQGAMGVVYRATQLSLGRMVALKVLPDSFAKKTLFLERLEYETKALSSLNHPNIVTIFERGTYGKTFYFVMEYVQGDTLRERMSRRLPVTEVLRVGVSAAKGLHYAHSCGVVHRDIKPSNIMITASGLVKIMDFGLARVSPPGSGVNQAPSESQMRMGTPGYISPEQMSNSLDVDGRTDVFSLGVVLYELSCGQRPKLPMPVPPSKVSPQADPRLDPIILTCLGIDRDDRYESAGALLRDLELLRREVETGPRCAKCRHLSPVRMELCEKCGQSLSEVFDSCPDCGANNRQDVRLCLSCGTDLHLRRREIEREIQDKFDHVNGLCFQENYGEAAGILSTIFQVKGRVHQGARERAKLYLKQVQSERKKVIERRLEDSKRLFYAGDFKGAIAVWKGHKRTRQAAELIQRACNRLNEQARVRKANDRTNTVLIFVAVALLVSVVVFSVVF